MSERGGDRGHAYDAAWVAAAARSRGLVLDRARAAEIAAEARPTLELLRAVAAELAADDDPQELRRILLVEAARA